MINRGRGLMRAGDVGLGVGTANDRARERDEELHLKGVRVRNESLIDLARILFYQPPNNFSTSLFTMTSFTIDNLSITRTDTRTHLPGVFGEGPYPEPAEVSTPALIGD